MVNVERPMSSGRRRPALRRPARAARSRGRASSERAPVGAAHDRARRGPRLGRGRDRRCRSGARRTISLRSSSSVALSGGCLRSAATTAFTTNGRKVSFTPSLLRRRAPSRSFTRTSSVTSACSTKVKCAAVRFERAMFSAIRLRRPRSGIRSSSRRRSARAAAGATRASGRGSGHAGSGRACPLAAAPAPACERRPS